MSAPFKFRFAARLGEAPAYSVPRAQAVIDLYLDANEGPRIDGVAEDPEQIAEAARRYPSAHALEAILAERSGLPADQLLVTAGGDDALFRLCMMALDPGSELILPSPSFEMIARYATLAGAIVRRVPWADEGPWPRQAVLDALGPKTRVIALVTPNNPTGRCLTAEDLRAIVEAAPQALILVDQAYVEYGGEDLHRLALSYANTVVVRTFSKAWGLAGLRVGYAMAQAPLIEGLRRAGQPYAVAGPSLAAVRARLGQEAQMRAHIERARAGRAQLRRLLVDLGWAAPADQQANFVFARAPRGEAQALWLRDGLAALGIGVRVFVGSPDLEGAVRITVPDRAEDLARLLAGLRTVLAPQALLLDVDGVIADVQHSYRAAIEGTCAHFGVQIGAAEIHAIKQAGDANNDWVVSHRLLEAHGVRRDFEEVKAVFEALYQGTEAAPGLWQRERLLIDEATLRRWAQRAPIALVTGRPRRDLERLLHSSGLTDLFAATICLEDAPRLKPDPAPVQAALAQLGVQHAWMLGDTPDDQRAARAAGVLPLAVLAPGEAPEAARAALQRAGAARIFAETRALEEVWS